MTDVQTLYFSLTLIILSMVAITIIQWHYAYLEKKATRAHEKAMADQKPTPAKRNEISKLGELPPGGWYCESTSIPSKMWEELKERVAERIEYVPSRQEQLDALKWALADAIEAEEYEYAAELQKDIDNFPEA